MDTRALAMRKKYQWILWAMVLLLLLIGCLCFTSSFKAPANKPEAAAELRGLAIWSICFAAAVLGIERATTAFTRNSNQES